MKKSAIEKIEKEIDEKRKLPKYVKEEIIQEVFTNIVIAIIIILYLIFLILGSVGSEKNIRIIDFNIFSVIFLGTAIVLFEFAYRKDKGKLAIYGIEALAIAIFTLFLPYIIFELDSIYKKYYFMASGYVALYYSIKSIYIVVSARKKYMTTVNDIKEIVKKEEQKRRIKEYIEEKEFIEESKIKEYKVGDDDNLESQNKRRGRIKKEKNLKSEEKLDTHQKRSRQKKVVTNND